MRTLNIDEWPRREHYALYRTYAQPHFNICFEVDVTVLRAALKHVDVGFTVGWLYVLSRIVNDIPEFRLRMRGDLVVEHDVVHPSITVLGEQGLFGFCLIEYTEDFTVFSERAHDCMQTSRIRPSLEVAGERDDVLFMTAVPWTSFTSFMHPIPTFPPDSIPRFAWGRYAEKDRRFTMPLSVQAHHALMDGVHVAELCEELQRLLDRAPDVVQSI